MTPTEELEKQLMGEVHYNREMRRKKPQRPRTITHGYVDVSSNAYTKATHKILKARKKNEPTKQKRKRTIAQARKDRKETYSQVS